jgi:hypothetical protein
MSTSSNLDVLLQQYAREIDALKILLLQDNMPLQPEYDDVWCLRFILSNGSAAASFDKCRATIQWRKERQAVLDKIKAGETVHIHQKISSYQVLCHAVEHTTSFIACIIVSHSS